LWVVFGAGGDRDVGKRPEMGRAASEYADRLIVTSDNPRSESPEAIIQDVLAGVGCNYEVQLDRVEAIRHAIQTMSEHDVLVIAGKGHETEQVLADRVLHHDDREVARAALAEVLC
jgi:UDP-N-acetylmuramyl tripeptide synthase